MMNSFVYVLTIALCAGEFPPKFQDDSSVGVPAGHLKKFGYHRPPDGPVAEETGFLHPKVFWEKYVSIHKPMVFRQAAAKSPAMSLWSDEYLMDNYGDLDVTLEVKRENRSLSAKRMNISSFIQKYKTEDIYTVSVLPDPMRQEIQVPSCLLCGTFRDYVHETNLWIGSGGTRSVIHYDADENLHCIVNGSKDFMMIDKVFKSYLPMSGEAEESGSGYSRVDPDSVDLLKYPGVAKVQWTYATVYPGDCLYIPSGYLHQVRSHSRTISATMLFTSTVENSFEDAGCEKESFEYTPLSAIDVHWTYKKGDSTIDMGYINVEHLRWHLLKFLETENMSFFTYADFESYYNDMKDDEEESNLTEKFFSALFQVGSDGKVSAEALKQLPRENLKMWARSLDEAHGPVVGDIGNVHEKDEL